MVDNGKFYGHWVILHSFGILYGHLAYFVVIWHIFPRFGMLYKKKSGNPVRHIFCRLESEIRSG
jgi:hypothetical protein